MTPISSAWIHASDRADTSNADDRLSTFLRVRPRLFGVACGMLRSPAAAEDVVQDVWVRWQMADRNGGDKTRDQRLAVGTLAPRNLRWTLAAGANRCQHRPDCTRRTRRGAAGTR